VTGAVAMGSLDTSVCIYEDELSALFGVSDWMIDCFNRLWTDGYFKYSTKSGDVVEITENATTIIGGCVPEFLKNISRTKSTVTVSSGFTSRSIFSFSSERSVSNDYWGEEPSAMTGVSEDDLVEDLKYIAANTQGEYTFSPAARVVLAAFDKEIRSTTDT